MRGPAAAQIGHHLVAQRLVEFAQDPKRIDLTKEDVTLDDRQPRQASPRRSLRSATNWKP